MNTIAITGHTSGIGEQIKNKFVIEGWRYLGFSRSNGFDLKSDIDKIVNECQIADVFVNNAYYRFCQVDLLYELFEVWKNENKTIINISSNSGNGTKNYVHRYAVQKSALDKACEQLQNIPNTSCKVINIRPGYVDTPMVSSVAEPKINSIDIADIIFWIVENTDKFLIQNLTVVPK